MEKKEKKVIAISYPNMPRSVYEDTLRYLGRVRISCERTDDGAFPNSYRRFKLNGCLVDLAYQENHGNQGSIHMRVSDAERHKVDKTFNGLEKIVLKLNKRDKQHK